MPSISTRSTSIELPDVLLDWPFKRTINPNYTTISAISSKWIESYHAFGKKHQKAFNKANFGLIASLAYPNASPEHLRTGCDLMNAFFVFDDISDVQSAAEVRHASKIIMDSLRNPEKPRPKGETVLGEIHRCFWSLATKSASSTAIRRFIYHYELYAEAVCQQAEDRENHIIRSIDEYLKLRRDTIGAKPSFDLLLLPMEIPDSLLDDPKVAKLSELAIDMIILANDIYSYNVEQSRGDDEHNMVAVVMQDRNLDVQGAMDFIGELYHKLADSFLASMHDLPRHPDPKVEASLATYVWGVGNWTTANVEWSFESERYFGTEGLKIMKHRQIQLLPKML